MAEYKMMIVDDNDGIRDSIKKFLIDNEVECESFETAEALLARLYPSVINEWEYMPDLIIIDLQLDKGQMQGIDLIKELNTRNAPCELLAISGAIPSQSFTADILCFGAAFLLAKPFNLDRQFFPHAKHLAKIGKKRRMYSIENPFEFHDETRMKRPVFLSYADEDKHLANGIRRHLEAFDIGVWYAPTALSIGSEWNREIRKGIKNAQIFIPLISDHFIASGMCLEELYNFRNRMGEDGKPNLLLLPVVDKISEQSRSSDLFKSVERKYHYSYLRPRFADCLTALIWKIQAYLKNQDL